MAAVDAVITTVVISLIALVGVAIMSTLVSTYPIPDGPLRPAALTFLSWWSTSVVLVVTLLGGFGFTILAILTRLR